MSEKVDRPHPVAGLPRQEDTMPHETIAETIARNTTQDALAQRAAEARASTVATRRRRAVEALRALPSGERHAIAVANGLLDAISWPMMEARKFAREIAEHPDANLAARARVALDALGALWAVL